MLDTATILGVRCALQPSGVYCGRAAQLEVTAWRAPLFGWSVVARDTRTGDVIAYGVGAALRGAEAHAQDDFAERVVAPRDDRRAA